MPLPQTQVIFYKEEKTQMLNEGGKNPAVHKYFPILQIDTCL